VLGANGRKKRRRRPPSLTSILSRGRRPVEERRRGVRRRKEWSRQRGYFSSRVKSKFSPGLARPLPGELVDGAAAPALAAVLLRRAVLA
jgi:hypothetical protein